MRGSPLLRTLGVLLVLMLTALPVWKLTHKTEAQSVIAPVPTAAKTEVKVELTFAHVPSEFQLLHLGKVIWKAGSPGESVSKVFEMEFPREGIELEIKAAWPTGTPVSAVRVTVTPGNGAPLEKSAWGAGSVDEVLTFSESGT